MMLIYKLSHMTPPSLSPPHPFSKDPSSLQTTVAVTFKGDMSGDNVVFMDLFNFEATDYQTINNFDHRLLDL